MKTLAAALLLAGFGAGTALAVRAAIVSRGLEPPPAASGAGSRTDADAAIPLRSVPPPARVLAKALGKLESASEEIGVAADITSRITSILVDEGDAVQAGQTLVQLDDTVQKAKVAAGEAAVRAARAHRDRLVAGARVEAIRKGKAGVDEAEALSRIAQDRAERARHLGEGGIFSRDENDWYQRDAQAQEARARGAREELAILEHETRAEDLEAASAELERSERDLAAARAELEKTVLRSPITGAVIRRNLRVGEAVSSFQVEPVVSVADLGHLRVRAEVDEIDIGKVRLGARAVAETDSFPDLRLEGKVVRLGRSMGRKTIRGTDPNERQDVRVREVLVDLESAADLPLGLRLIVSFLE